MIVKNKKKIEFFVLDANSESIHNVLLVLMRSNWTLSLFFYIFFSSVSNSGNLLKIMVQIQVVLAFVSESKALQAYSSTLKIA